MDLRDVQRPLKERYRSEPDASRVTLRARGSQTDAPVNRSVDIGRAIQAAEAHVGVGARVAAPARAICSSARSRPARDHLQMVATAMGIEARRIEVTVEGDLELGGTLGVLRDVPVGFEAIRLRLEVDAPEASADELEGLSEKTERYRTVLQTLTQPAPIAAELVPS